MPVAVAEVAFHLRVEGYKTGLQGINAVWSGRIDRLFPDFGFGFHTPEFQLVMDEYTSGLHDGYLAFAKQRPDLFLSPAEAATKKQVDVNTIWRMLRDKKRVDRYFQRSVYDGDGKRRIWYLHIDDVNEWVPAPQGRKRRQNQPK
jgi:hypothetical protein